jgi:hypothetical protein
MRAAWDSTDREGGLNRAVEAMATEGATREDLTAALTRLLEAARAAGADEETEEIINCVGDRLHGWGSPKYRIKFPPPPIPSAGGNGTAAPSEGTPAPADAS